MTGKTTLRNGFFITLEGGEGAGKSSQLSLLQDKLVEQGLEVVVTREPGGTTGAEIMRHVLLSGAAEPFGPELEALLFAAARMDHVDQVVVPALARGAVVLCDRFIDSTRIYQGKCGKVDMDMLKLLETVACEDAFPNLTIVLDLDPKLGMERAQHRRAGNLSPDRFEKEALKEQERRHQGFLELAREEPERIKVVKASGSPKQVAGRIWKLVFRHLVEARILEPVS